MKFFCVKKDEREKREVYGGDDGGICGGKCRDVGGRGCGIIIIYR